MSIDNLQDPATLAAIAIGVDKICGLVWNAIAGNAGTAAATACTYKTPFRVGVHFDASEALAIAPQQAGGDNFSAVENVVCKYCGQILPTFLFHKMDSKPQSVYLIFHIRK